MGTDEDLSELHEAALRANDLVTEQIESIIEGAERDAEAIRREAAREAEDVRREAVRGATRLLDRLHGLEFPLGELVVSLRDEVEDVSRQLERGEHVDSHATPLSPTESPNAQTGEEVDASVPAEGPSAGPPEVEPDVQAVGEPEKAVAGGRESSPVRGENGPKLGRGGRRRQRSKQAKGPFLTSAGHCGVCHRTLLAGSEDELEASGWRVSGNAGVCPDCQAEGWQLPEGARVPVRPGGR